MKKLLFIVVVGVSFYVGFSTLNSSIEATPGVHALEAVSDIELDPPGVYRLVPCPHYNGNQCKSSTDKYYQECYHLTYCL